jgi:hypothetical protein
VRTPEVRAKHDREDLRHPSNLLAAFCGRPRKWQALFALAERVLWRQR